MLLLPVTGHATTANASYSIVFQHRGNPRIQVLHTPKLQINRDIPHCDSVQSCGCVPVFLTNAITSTLLHPEDGGDMILWNVGDHQHDCPASEPEDCDSHMLCNLNA